MQFLQTIMREIVGRRITSVHFVEDSVQFQFDGSRLTAFTPPHLISPTETVAPEDPKHRPGLLAVIGETVAAILVSQDELRIDLTNSSAITVSLQDQDYIGPEAINYTSLDGTIVVG